MLILFDITHSVNVHSFRDLARCSGGEDSDRLVAAECGAAVGPARGPAPDRQPTRPIAAELAASSAPGGHLS